MFKNLRKSLFDKKLKIEKFKNQQEILDFWKYHKF